MRISYLIFIGFSLILLLFAATTYINFAVSKKVNENAEYVSRSSEVVQNSNRFQRNILNMVSGLRGFLLTGETYFLQAYDSAATENQGILSQLLTQFEDSTYQYKLLIQIDSLSDNWLNEFAHPLRQAKISAEASDTNIASFNRLYREKMFSREERDLNVRLQQRIREFITIQYDKRAERITLLSSSVEQTRRISFILTTISVLLALFIVTFLSYRISKRISRMTEMANSIAGGNYEVHTEETGQDELSKLARSLNHMAEVLSSNITELKKKNQELDQFAHIVSHDMKAPLRGIDNVVSWIEEDHKTELSPKMAEYIELIKGRVRRGENLIQGLLSYARIDKEQSHKEEVNLDALIREILDNQDPGKKVKVLTITSLPVFHTERVPLFQVFSNLISNAIKYNDKKEAMIEISHIEFPDHYEFKVKDNGPGIGKNYHEKIFYIFQTLQERDSFESTGVGLAIVKKILDSRDETISVESEPGKGASFSFSWKK